MQRPGRGEAAHAASAVLAAWAVSLGFDLFLHGGLLAWLYIQPGGFLLPPEAAFRRIPIGYLAFLALTASLFWLYRRLGVQGAMAGFRYGATFGAVVWGAFAAGLYSISTVPSLVLASWWAGQTIELGLAGMVLGAVANGMPLKRLWVRVIAAVVLCLLATVVLQTLGLAPAVKAPSRP